MNPLEDHPEIRRALYIIQWVVTGVMGVLGIILSVNGDGVTGLPQWYLVTGLVLNFVWTYTGITAGVNVSKKVDRA
jgi:hypothetical protein